MNDPKRRMTMRTISRINRSIVTALPSFLIGLGIMGISGGAASDGLALFCGFMAGFCFLAGVVMAALEFTMQID